MSTAAKVVLWVLGSVVTLLLLGAGALWWGLSGGWDGIRPAAQPEDAAVVEAREASAPVLVRLADQVGTAVAEGTTPLGAADVDQCSPGQNNWKIHDGFTLQCSQARAVGVQAGRTTVPDVSSDLDARLRSLGWVPTSYGEMEVLASRAHADARYAHPDDPGAELVVEVAAAGRATPYVSLGRHAGSWSRGDATAVTSAVERATGTSVLVVVQRTYFQDD